MESITTNMDTKNESQLWVQISAGGQVTLSFDTRHTSTVLSGLSVGDLKEYHELIGDALSLRAKEVKKETDES